MQMIESVKFFTSYDANKYLGKLFRLRRKEQKISELELSKLLGISQQQVSRYEN
ncbi:putative transcriptional regulator [Providencia alcalifaciens]|nr:putative transcriptional regulator [Providencia alcalifaciens]